MKRHVWLFQALNDHLRLLQFSFLSSFAQYASVRSRVVMHIGRVLMEVLTFGILATRLLDKAGPTPIDLCGANSYKEFILSGIILGRIAELGELISPAFFRGEYKNVHSKPFALWVVALTKRLDYYYFWYVAEVLVCMSAAYFVFDVHIQILNCKVLLVLIMGCCCRTGLALFSSAWSILTQSDGDPLSWAFRATQRLVSGEVLPIHALPPWLICVSYFHPQTYVNSLARQISFGKTGSFAAISEFGVLAMLSTSFMTVGIATLYFALKVGKSRGTLKW